VSPASRRLIIRLQEVAGLPETTVHLQTPVAVKKADVVNLTEENVIQAAIPTDPLKVKVRSYEVVTLRLELESRE
jgi:hypothetical protein